MLMNLEVIDWFNVSDIAGYLLLLPIFPFSVKSAIVYFKVERKDSGEKLKSTKYYQLLILELVIVIAFILCIWQLAIIISVIAAVVIFITNKVINNKYSKSEPDEYTSDIAMKLKDILIEFVFSVFEGFAVSFLFINENTSILNGLK